MNETEKDRILNMVAEGVIRPGEAAQLLAALAEDAPAPKAKDKAKDAEPEKKRVAEKAPTMEVQMQRADGSTYTIEVPTNMVPMFMSLAGAAIKESARAAAKEAWTGIKDGAKTKFEETRDAVKAKVTGTGGKTSELPASAVPLSDEQKQSQEARKRILQMVQNGRVSAEDASKLIQQLDALQEYQKTH